MSFFFQEMYGELVTHSIPFQEMYGELVTHSLPFHSHCRKMAPMCVGFWRSDVSNYTLISDDYW